MDNSNNPNSSNISNPPSEPSDLVGTSGPLPNPASRPGGLTQDITSFGINPAPNWSPPPPTSPANGISQPQPITPELTSPWPPPPAQSQPSQTQTSDLSQNPSSATPLDYSSNAPTADYSSPWTPPAPSQPQQPTYPTNTPPMPQSPTFTPPIESTPQPISELNSSPLDNPWGAPSQPPPINEELPISPQPTWTPPPVSSPLGTNLTSTPTPTEAGGMESRVNDSAAPTDLSHLISGNTPVGENLSYQTTPETLIVPSIANSTPEVPTLPSQEYKGIPKWLIGVGVGLILVVTGASAYFILGIGQPPKTTTSLPATQTSITQQVKPPPPIATPISQPTQPTPATGSANFEQLQGSGNTQQATSSGSTTIDTLRQRQQGR